MTWEHHRNLLHHAMFIIPVLAMLAASVLFAAASTVEKDMAKRSAT